MDLTHYLERMPGSALAILSASMILRRRYFVTVFASFAEQRLLRAIMARAELLAGLFLIVAYPIRWPMPDAIISIIGYLAAIETTLYLLLPGLRIAVILAAFGHPRFYLVGGVVSLVIGLSRGVALRHMVRSAQQTALCRRAGAGE